MTTSDYRTRDLTGKTFLCESPCPSCGQTKVIGYYFVTEAGHHQHTHYVCTFWPTALNPDGSYTHRERCGWHGWSIPTDEEEQD